jgi:hypothetical protein
MSTSDRSYAIQECNSSISAAVDDSPDACLIAEGRSPTTSACPYARHAIHDIPLAAGSSFHEMTYPARRIIH